MSDILLEWWDFLTFWSNHRRKTFDDSDTLPRCLYGMVPAAVPMILINWGQSLNGFVNIRGIILSWVSWSMILWGEVFTFCTMCFFMALRLWCALFCISLVALVLIGLGGALMSLLSNSPSLRWQQFLIPYLL